MEILYQDDLIVAVNKPNGLLVHRTKIAEETQHFALQKIRDQTGKKVYPIHRLDRPTSGVLLFAFDSITASHLKAQFDHHQVQKKYLAVCRGYCPEEGTIDLPLANETTGKIQEARTAYKRLATIEIPIHVSRYPTSRYSLVEAMPETGRYHQIRKHFAKIRHYLIGDTKHGDLPHNRMFQQHLACSHLLLHAWKLNFQHPAATQEISLEAPLPTHFTQVLEAFNWHLPS